MNASQGYTYQQIAAAIGQLVATYQQPPTLAELAERANLSEFHCQRLFTGWAGVSPKKFSQYLTLDYAKDQLRNGAALAEAAHAVGLSGTGRLHDLFVSFEGVTPGQFKQAGVGLTLHYGLFASPFGTYLLGLIQDKIAVLHFLNEHDVPERLLAAAWPEASLRHDSARVQPVAERIFPGTSGTLGERLPVLLRGSVFRLKVWEALLRIPEGRLVSYDSEACCYICAVERHDSEA